MKRKLYPLEVLLWSIAFPGFGQILNKAYIRGALFISLEFIINVNANLNMNIVYSFQGRADKAISVTNYEWAMFYPCVYMFGIYESYLCAIEKTGESPGDYLSLPFIGGAYFSTVGVIFSNLNPELTIIPPTFVAIAGIILGCILGVGVRRWLRSRSAYIEKP